MAKIVHRIIQKRRRSTKHSKKFYENIKMLINEGCMQKKFSKINQTKVFYDKCHDVTIKYNKKYIIYFFMQKYNIYLTESMSVRSLLFSSKSQQLLIYIFGVIL